MATNINVSRRIHRNAVGILKTLVAIGTEATHPCARGGEDSYPVVVAITDEDLLVMVVEAAHAAFEKKLETVGADQFTPFMRAVLLQNIDSHWREHLSSLDYLRQGIHLRGYAQKQPKQEYKREAFELFGQLLDMVKNEVTRILMTVQIEKA